MTSRELKFALKVESLLNTVDDPEYRQLLVEVLMVLSLVVKDDPAQPLGHTIVVNHILQDANHLFVEDQVCVRACVCVHVCRITITQDMVYCSSLYIRYSVIYIRRETC